jgi:hypothetical protein
MKLDDERDDHGQPDQMLGKTMKMAKYKKIAAIGRMGTQVNEATTEKMWRVAEIVNWLGGRS